MSTNGLSLTESEKFGRAIKNDQRGVVIQLTAPTATTIFSTELHPTLSTIIN